MEELQKGLDICISGAARDEALARFIQQAREWDAALPPVDPLVLDFGLGEFSKFGLIEYWIANEMQAGYCGKYLFVFDGQTCPMHCHRDKVETFFIVKGRVSMTCDGRTFEMKPGDVHPVETWKYHSFTGIGPALLLEVSKPCLINDNYFENTSIPIGGNYKGGAAK